MPFDLILRGGRLIDPSQKLDTTTDVAFADGKPRSEASSRPVRGRIYATSQAISSRRG